MSFKLLTSSGFCLILLAVTPAQAAIDSPREWFDEFCDDILISDSMAADFLVESVSFGQSESVSAIEGKKLNFQGQLGQLRATLGAPVSCTFGYQGKIGSDVVGLTYVLNYPLRPVILLGHFVRLEGKWRVYGLDFVTETPKFPYLPQN